MEKELQKVKPEVIELQKEAVLKEVATLKLQHSFMNEEHDKEKASAEKLKDKEVKETKLENLAKHKLQKLIPMSDNIVYKSNYYKFLCEQESNK